MNALRTRITKLAAVGLSLVLCLGMFSAAPAFAAAAGTSTVDKSAITAGQSVIVTASGFADEEEIVSWATAPSGAVYSTAKGYANAAGKIALGITAGRFWEAGVWSITLHGVSSGVETISTVTLSAAAANSQLDVAPASAAAGDEISFHGSGYSADDAINVWVTGPNGVVSAVAADLTSSNGEVWFTYSVPTDAAAGTYYMTAYGQSSGQLQIVAFKVAA